MASLQTSSSVLHKAPGLEHDHVQVVVRHGLCCHTGDHDDMSGHAGELLSEARHIHCPSLAPWKLDTDDHSPGAVLTPPCAEAPVALVVEQSHPRQPRWEPASARLEKSAQRILMPGVRGESRVPAETETCTPLRSKTKHCIVTRCHAT